MKKCIALVEAGMSWSREVALTGIAWTKKHAQKLGVASALAGILLFWAWFSVQQPPVFFPVRTIVTIPEGATLHESALILKESQVVRSAVAYQVAVHFKDLDTNIKAGDYYFHKPLELGEVVMRVTQGEFGLEPIRITIPEGTTTYQMAQLYEDTFANFDATTFLLLSRDKEGYLFPDTYFFLPNVNTVEVLQAMERTFYERLSTLEDKIASFGRPVHEVVTMASLLEKEARDFNERKTIAGILWKRLQINMPLQVDAVFGFIEKTGTFNPTLSDLEIDSIYNTYKYKGLPPGPIGSPSLSSLEAAVSPVETDALFYLHGRDGELRVAQTYSQHVSNKRHYLD